MTDPMDVDSASGPATPTPAVTPAEEKPRPKRPGGSGGSTRPALKDSGIQRVDNAVRSSLFGGAVQINQKNYYTDYLRKDDQVMFYREWNEEMKRQKELKDLEKSKPTATAAAATDTPNDTPGATPAPAGPDDPVSASAEEKQPVGSKTIVLHLGSRNLRLGLASQAYPKSTPNVIAHKLQPGESPPPLPVFPQRNSTTDEDGGEVPPDLMFGAEFKEAHSTVYRDFRERMRFYKRRVVPNSHELVVSYNKRVRDPESIPDHNDPGRIEWTEPGPGERYITGARALRIAEDAGYKLRWPIQFGMFNEQAYTSPQELLGDLSLILVDALERELGIKFKEYNQYNVVFLIPDLFEKTYVEGVVSLLLQMGLANVCVLQESMGATFGAGVSSACVIDIGAQTTKVSCIEEGMVIPESRVNLKYGGDDVTLALTKLLLSSSFPYSDINLARPFDFTLAEELKYKYATMNDADITVQHYSFYQRSPSQPSTKKYEFKTFEEVMLAPLGLFYPDLFDQRLKRQLYGTKPDGSRARYSIFPKPEDIYEEDVPGDQSSAAQQAIAKGALSIYAVPSDEPETPATAAAASTETSTPAPADDDTKPSTTTASASASTTTAAVDTDPLHMTPTGLDFAIIESITQAACSKASLAPGPAQHAATVQMQQNFYENLLVVGGAAAKLPGFNGVLTDRVGMWLSHAERPLKSGASGAAGGGAGAGAAGGSGDIVVMPAPREMDPQVLTWKGGGVFAKLKIANECWISARDWDMLGARSLQYKSLFAYY